MIPYHVLPRPTGLLLPWKVGSEMEIDVRRLPGKFSVGKEGAGQGREKLSREAVVAKASASPTEL